MKNNIQHIAAFTDILYPFGHRGLFLPKQVSDMERINIWEYCKDILQ